MRTTLNLADDVLRAARAMADEQGRSIGDVVSDLAREALRPDRGIASRNGFPVFDVPPDAPPITPEMIRRALDDE